MSNRKAAQEIKKIKDNVLHNIEKLGFKIELRKDLGKSIYSLNDETNIDLIYSSLSKGRNEYFFGIEEEQFYKAYKNNRNYFQIFICEDSDQVFIIPLSFMIEILKDTKANDHITFHQWKPVIRKRNGVYILRLDGIYDITDYYNRYDYLFQNEKSSISSPIKFNAEIEVKSEIKKMQETAINFGLDKKDIHSTTIFMLKKLGEWLGYKVLTESKLVGVETFPYQIDCLWYKDNDLFLAIEVCNKGSIEKDKDALKQAKNFGARKVIIVSDITKLERIRKIFMYNGEIKFWTEIWSFNRIFNMFENGQKFFKDFSKFKNYQWNENIVEYV
ncbi:MAG: hypothetical protein FWG85_03325 [Bacteroidetes bacterium]|nr:hypothetical protein [Bacteroidota bacterium]